MTVNIFSLYLQGLLLAIVVTVTVLGSWVLYRRIRQKDKTLLEKRRVLLDALALTFISIPILSFAFMAILIMLKA